MTRHSQLLDLIVQWEDRRAAGTAITPEELCADCPELIGELRASIEALAGMDDGLDGSADPPPNADATQPFDSSRSGPNGRGAAYRPSIPGYEILAELGRGGMGVVYKARQIALERMVAIKTIRSAGWGEEEQRRRFAREALAMARLTHPNIVQVYEIGQQDGHPFLVMEYVGGENLDELLDGKPMPPRDAAVLAATLARAVHAAHREGVVHRDLKPNNVLIAPDGTPKICDFGLARCLQIPIDCTQTGCLMGTPSYMAPEQALGTRDALRPTVDVYALGALLYELLTGRPPFLADNALDTLKMVASEEPAPVRALQPHTPRDLETIVLKCLAKEPYRRYVSAHDLADDLDRFLAGEPIFARPAGAAERGWQWCRRHPGAAAAATVAAVAVVILFAVTLAYNRRLAWQLGQTEAARREVLAADEQLQGTLTREVAERVNGDLRELASIPLALAAMLSHQRSWEETGLQHAIRDMLKETPMIFGMCVAFEPRAWQSDREDFALYVYRRGEELAVKQLVPPYYEPHYRQWQWYHAAKDAPDGVWTEPYVDAGAERTPMVTFSVPVMRDGRFVGVVTADLAMKYFHELRTSLDRLEVGRKGYGFAISGNGQILAHRLDDYEFPGSDCDLTRKTLDPTFRKLLDRMRTEPQGKGRAIDAATGQPASFFFARVPATGWTLVNVVEGEGEGRD